MTTSPAQEPSPQERTIALPPTPDPAPGGGLRPEPRDANTLLSGLVLVLAFLSASFLARNSDVWFHLATGRLLAEREFSFGIDPFAYTTEGVYWANHAWLFDLGLYGLYNLVGGAGLVVLKALLVTALAALLLGVRRPGSGPGLPVVCTTLAVIAMSPRLLLQPACVSYFLLGLTFWLLWRPQTPGKHGTPAFPLLAVFALWVNFDEWFLLGPALVALFWVGERLEGRRQTPGWLVPAGLAVCLLNPYTFHAFTLPPELAVVSWTGGLRQDTRLAAQFASPWQPLSLHPAAVAYYVLTALGLISFLLNPKALRGWRLVVWLPFALLAAWQARTIPFFAVVAAPITALNGQDFLADHRWVAASLKLAGAVLLVPALLALIFFTWPGWLAGQGRHVAWGLQADPSLERVARTLEQWRRQGLLAQGERVFALSPDVAHYSAWFCPGERHFFDHRYRLFPGAAQDFETVCQALQPDLFPGQSVAKNWREVLRQHGVSIVVFSDREPQRLGAVLHRLAAEPRHWTLLQVPGQALIAGWNAARPEGAFAPLAFDADRLAFGAQDARAQQELPAAPEEGPEHLPPRRDFWARFIRPPAPSSWESAAATLYLRWFDEGEAGQREQQLHGLLRGFAASLAGLAAVPSTAPAAALQLTTSRHLLWPRDSADTFLVRNQLGPFFVALVERPPALPLLAVRAARQAVAINPEDSVAWLRLGQAYLLLRSLTAERTAEGLLPPLVQLRHVQIATALEQALRLDPDLEEAHHELAYLYGERNYLDQSLEHRRVELRLCRQAPHAGETAEEWAHRRQFVEADTAKLEKLVGERRQSYAAASPRLQGERVPQALLALRHGLARQALEEVLLPSPADVLGAAGMKLELEMLLCLGRVEEVRPILNDERMRASKDGLLYLDISAPKRPDGTALYTVPYHWPAYEWLQVLQAAAVGDYGQARGALAAIRLGLSAGNERLKRQLRDLTRTDLALLPGLLCGPLPFLPAFTAQVLDLSRQRRAALEDGEPVLRAQQADLCVLEGLLALEQAAPEDARSALTAAQQLAEQPPAAVSFAGRPIAAAYLGKLYRRE
jgi:hypothetical protein